MQTQCEFKRCWWKSLSIRFPPFLLKAFHLWSHRHVTYAIFKHQGNKEMEVWIEETLLIAYRILHHNSYYTLRCVSPSLLINYSPIDQPLLRCFWEHETPQHICYSQECRAGLQIQNLNRSHLSKYCLVWWSSRSISWFPHAPVLVEARGVNSRTVVFSCGCWPDISKKGITVLSVKKKKKDKIMLKLNLKTFRIYWKGWILRKKKFSKGRKCVISN